MLSLPGYQKQPGYPATRYSFEDQRHRSCDCNSTRRYPPALDTHSLHSQSTEKRNNTGRNYPLSLKEMKYHAFLIKKNNQSIKTLMVFNVAQVIKVHVILRQKLTRSKPITWLPLIKQSHHAYGFKWFNLIVQCAQSCWWAKNPKLNWKI